MNILMGILLLLYGGVMAFYCRPVQKESLASLFLCVLAGVIALLSAPPASAAIGAILLFLQAALAGICGKLLFIERRERREKAVRQKAAQKPRWKKTSAQSLQRPRIAG